MNGFTSNVRRELASRFPSSACCRKALLYGMLINGQCGVGGTVYAKITGEESTALLVKLIRELYGRETEPAVSNSYGRYQAETVIPSEKLAGALNEISDPENVSRKLPFLNCPGCAGAFCAGLLLSSATFSDPDKSSRLEIRVSDPVTASRLTEFFSGEGIFPSLSGRNGISSLLIKRSEDVESVLTLSGAVSSAMELMQHKLMREFRGDVNRKSNCELRNLSRTVDAAGAQTEAVEALISAGALNMLSEELQITARLRLQYPELSLTELALRHDPPISRSGLNHRLEKILRSAEKIRKK